MKTLEKTRLVRPGRALSILAPTLLSAALLTACAESDWTDEAAGNTLAQDSTDRPASDFQSNDAGIAIDPAQNLAVTGADQPLDEEPEAAAANPVSDTDESLEIRYTSALASPKKAEKTSKTRGGLTSSKRNPAANSRKSTEDNQDQASNSDSLLTSVLGNESDVNPASNTTGDLGESSTAMPGDTSEEISVESAESSSSQSVPSETDVSSEIDITADQSPFTIEVDPIDSADLVQDIEIESAEQIMPEETDSNVGLGSDIDTDSVLENSDSASQTGDDSTNNDDAQDPLDVDASNTANDGTDYDTLETTQPPEDISFKIVQPADDSYQESSIEAVSRFSSHTTPGFEGEVLEDTIRVTWEADPAAEGYNVYRQAKWVKSVMTNEYIDTDVFDDDYYYEIQAWDRDKNLYYIATGLTVSPRTFGRTDPNAAKADPTRLDDYELVFADEFTGMSLDSSKWNTAYLWGPDLVINREEQYYVDILRDPDFGYDPFSFNGDHLTINSIPTPPELAAKANHQPYLSGVITSYDAFKFTYGYAEMRAKMTFGRGYWPAFWLLNAYYGGDDPEIDIMEFIGNDQDVVYHTYHYYDSNGQLRSTKSKPTPGIDYTSDFHTFAVEWMPGVLIFLVDGIEVHRVIDPKVSQEQMYVIANTALGGWWAGSPDATTPFPGEYIIDYIRVYQRITPYENLLFDAGMDQQPHADETPGTNSPSHRPSFEQWPEGYPYGQR